MGRSYGKYLPVLSTLSPEIWNFYFFPLQTKKAGI